VRDALTRAPGEWAVSISGGKDSTALLHVCLSAGWHGPLFHFWYEETPPENTALAAELARRFDSRLDTVRVPGAFDVWAAAGHAFIFPQTDAERRAVRGMLRGYKAGAAGAQRAAGYAGIFMGLRAEESRARSFVVAKKGTIYAVADRPGLTALPLARWSARDVWAYLIAHDLPWLGCYDRTDDRERERSEPTYLAAPGIWRYEGIGQRLRQTDPALWQRLTTRFPELERFG